jgi:hypothetical protein
MGGSGKAISLENLWLLDLYNDIHLICHLSVESLSTSCGY